MIRQYHPQRGRTVTFAAGNIARSVRVGSIEAGAVFYLQDGVGPFGRSPHAPAPVCRAPWIVEAWHPREIGASRRGPDGRYESTRAAGGHLATVRSLRDGQRRTVADWLLRWHDDNGFTVA